jgi:anti-sigma B factor antagonist
MGIYRATGPPVATPARCSVPASLWIEERPGVWLLTARGELDYADCSAFRSMVERVVQARPEACIVDFSGVEYLDSSCLGQLLSLHRDYCGAGGRLALVASKPVGAILDVTRLDGMFEVAADIASALASLSDQSPPSGPRITD